MKNVETLNIRAAKPQDCNDVVPLMVQAMEELACAFANTNKVEDTYELFAHFFQKKENQYSFDHTLVYEEDGLVMGSITTYAGNLLPIYRKPFMEYIAEKYGVNDLVIEDETAPGEVYIDTVSVSPNYQGKGIGKKLIAAAMNKARVEGHEKIGLLVDFNNPNAKKLYLKLGFQSVGRKQLGDGDYEHLQLKL